MEILVRSACIVLLKLSRLREILLEKEELVTGRVSGFKTLLEYICIK